MSDRNVWTNAIVGGVVTLLTVFVPFSPAIGGALSGYLHGRNGVRVGALSGFVASLPVTAVGYVVTTVFLDYGDAGPFPGGVAILVSAVFFLSTVYSVAFGALGGYLGTSLGDIL